ncbi:MAG: hypothetical protein LBC18_09995, partial [Opitutaceae bacterium]|nr:hypothetical protein [Opitutaceae bacterium]
MSPRIIAALFAALAPAMRAGAAEPGAVPLAEVPAEIVVKPAGALAKGRPYQGTPSSVVTASGQKLFVAWYGNGVDENYDNYVMVATGDARTLRFGDLKLVIRSPHLGKVRCYDPAVWRDASGRVYISWCQNAEGHRPRGTWCIYTDNP